MTKEDDKLIKVQRELTAGLHKTGLAVHGITVTQESHERRLTALESTVISSNNSLQTRVARSEDRLKRLEETTRSTSHSLVKRETARIQGRATVIAAWVGGVTGVIAAIVALIVALSK